ncbi:GYD domain-containing protein [Microvirga arabica]|uniref:GYD domain-containing protein n=1 Tax=Microvirga arabica TaxID=1128671 RepID=UPI00193A2784|nr:GYD domain-containing protein [Microvirga arabica]MBM1173424.1 GYD domain-containing protein [Microvirga arabica]
MPTFIGYGRFTREAMRGMLQTPEDRTEPVSKLFKALGGRLISWHMTPGADFDWMLLAEAPDEEVVVTAGLVATGGGGVQDIKVARALSGPEAMRLFQKGGEAARGFKSAGQPAPSEGLRGN